MNFFSLRLLPYAILIPNRLRKDYMDVPFPKQDRVEQSLTKGWLG